MTSMALAATLFGPEDLRMVERPLERLAAGMVRIRFGAGGHHPIEVEDAVTAFLQYPNGDNKSVSINQRALPKLITEAVSAQSASVSSISGATYTSRSYIKSLQSAIDAAKAASGIA